jgi:stage II sporulation protein D
MLTRSLAGPGEPRKNGSPLPWCAPLRLARSQLLLLILSVVPLLGGGRVGQATAGLRSGPPIRVLLLEAPLITVGAAGREGLRLRDQSGRSLLQVAPGQQLRMRRLGDSLALEPLPPPAIGQETEAVALPPASRQVPVQELRLEPVAPQGLIVLKQRRYRGVLLLRPEGEGLQAINRLPLESYLAGVVGSEMPGTWPLAALKAQAVASRTYALQQLRPTAPFDLKATVASQVYKGVEAESLPTREAVSGTRSQVLMHGERLINAVFHSSSGGATENSGELWSRQLPYLVSVPDFDTSSPVSRWEKAFPPETLRQTFAEIGGVTTIQPLQSSSTGRVRRARVIGPEGELLLSGSELRERLGLRSTLVQFRFEPAGRLEMSAVPNALEDSSASSAPPPGPGSLRLVVQGRGYGHGVGMSQWGAYALAQRGKSYEDILRHYYRGAVLRTF